MLFHGQDTLFFNPRTPCFLLSRKRRRSSGPTFSLGRCGSPVGLGQRRPVVAVLVEAVHAEGHQDGVAKQVGQAEGHEAVGGAHQEDQAPDHYVAQLLEIEIQGVSVIKLEILKDRKLKADQTMKIWS